MSEEHRTVLLLMDFQREIVDRLGNAAVLANARTAADAARAAGIPVVFVRVAFRAGTPEIAAANRSFGPRKGSDALDETSPAAQVVAELDRRPDEPVVLKRRISAFTGSDLAVLLSGLRAERLVLAGISTSGVVLSTVRQAADLDFDLVVLADACADPDAEVHRVLTEKVFPRQAAVVATADWAASPA
ncbi:cysteine hydrolase family protein [Amnibacterium kyonggiense]|uniref:Nicotinamidase-related amidase n=1 Tax=Amnibacterium kyonggiense TaxID=595671 RepID=A0A4R7FRU4_9MICO|nr:isochorismatase family cysteine hydrolase [Amnibacterium kyonggiense]TDS80547.1 nicotinamidase-related amidase [Amnibacterium kyonggiense]